MRNFFSKKNGAEAGAPTSADLSGCANDASGAFQQQTKELLPPDRNDTLFSIFVFVLGFLFVRFVLSGFSGWGVAVFAALYSLSVCLYFLKKGIRMKGESRFWFVVMLLLGISFALYPNEGLGPFPFFLLFCAGVYFVLHTSGQTILGRTSDFLFLDGLNGVFVIPFRNFGFQYQSLANGWKGKKGRTGKIAPVLLGLLFALFLSAAILPDLFSADSGGFSKIANGIQELLNRIGDEFYEWIFQMILAIPVSAYLFGLIAGCANHRGCGAFRGANEKTPGTARVLPEATVFTALFILCFLYAVFIFSQVPYFVSAFQGMRPEGYLVFSEYARRGFFELIRICALNLSLLFAANLFSKKPRKESVILRLLNIALSGLTLFLIATAMSKMALYIHAYGLSIRRLLPCVFMVFLTIICVCVILLQKRDFSILRVSVIVGSAILCVLSLMNPDKLVANYNADRYLAGTLSDFDTQILYQVGASGVDAALRVSANTKDGAVKAEIRQYLFDIRELLESDGGTPRDTLQAYFARGKIADLQ